MAFKPSTRKPTPLHPNRGLRVKPKYLSSSLRPNKRTRLTLEEWQDLRAKLCDRANAHCENPACQRCLPLAIGEAHHIKRRSQGGRDEITNLLWLCGRCHRRLTGVPEWSRNAERPR